jgi:hypothetical protein
MGNGGASVVETGFVETGFLGVIPVGVIAAGAIAGCLITRRQSNRRSNSFSDIRSMATPPGRKRKIIPDEKAQTPACVKSFGRFLIHKTFSGCQPPRFGTAERQTKETADPALARPAALRKHFRRLVSV